MIRPSNGEGKTEEEIIMPEGTIKIDDVEFAMLKSDLFYLKPEDILNDTEKIKENIITNLWVKERTLIQETLKTQNHVTIFKRRISKEIIKFKAHLENECIGLIIGNTLEENGCPIYAMEMIIIK